MTFSEKVTELFNRLKAGEAALVDRQSRIQVINDVIEGYFAEYGKMPEAVDLERLGTLILHEELTDKNEHKVSQQERPFLGEKQQERRQARELTVDVTQTHGVDGRNHRKPVRRRA